MESTEQTHPSPLSGEGTPQPYSAPALVFPAHVQTHQRVPNATKNPGTHLVPRSQSRDELQPRPPRQGSSQGLP